MIASMRKLTTALLAFAAIGTATAACTAGTSLPCPDGKDQIGAGLCEDPESGLKRQKQPDTDALSKEKAEAGSDKAEKFADGRDDVVDPKARAEQRKAKIETLLKDASRPAP